MPQHNSSYSKAFFFSNFPLSAMLLLPPRNDKNPIYLSFHLFYARQEKNMPRLLMLIHKRSVIIPNSDTETDTIIFHPPLSISIVISIISRFCFLCATLLIRTFDDVHVSVRAELFGRRRLFR